MHVIISFLLLFTFVLPGFAQEGNEAEVTEWICPMKCDDLRFDGPDDCPVCGMKVVPHKVRTTSDFFGDDLLEGAEEVVAPPERALMPGLASTHFYAGLLCLLLLTGILGFRLRRLDIDLRRTRKRWDYPRFELTRSSAFKTFAKSKAFQPILQAPVVLLFLLVIVAGLFGNQDPARNIAPVLTWNIWWMGLIFFAFLAGHIWCTVCPWMAIPDAITRLAARIRKRARPIGLHLKWPRSLRSLLPVTALFIFISWLELAYEAPYRPAFTALMAIGMVVGAGLTLVIFEKKAFCRWLCPVGRVTGQYATTGMLEIRRKDSDICFRCTTKDCLRGNERGLPCPTEEFMGAMNENTYCTMCTECLKTCPHDNIAVNVRAPMVDLLGPHRKRLDEAVFIVVIFAITIFHGLAMIPIWTHNVVPPLRETTLKHIGFDPGYLTTFTFGMMVFLAIFGLLYLGLCYVIKTASGSKTLRLKDFFVGLSYTLLPLALGYHLAHNALHFFYEGSKLVRLLSDPFGWGFNFFGTAEMPLTMLVPLETLWVAQVLLVLLAQGFSVYVVHRGLSRIIGNRRQRNRAFIAACVCLILLNFMSLWLLNQPMEMRTA